MRYSIRAALTTLLVGLIVWGLTNGSSLAPVAAIAEANDLQGPTVPADTMLLIPM